MVKRKMTGGATASSKKKKEGGEKRWLGRRKMAWMKDQDWDALEACSAQWCKRSEYQEIGLT